MNKTKSFKIIATMVIAILTLLWGMYFSCSTVYAETGTVSSCTINRCYRHPVSGAIEDSGGEGSFATGQGMVEGCVYGYGLFEKTTSGKSYVTIKMSLTDMTKNRAFSVQSWGAGGWTPASVTETSYGSDENGTTIDYCIPVPSKDCVIRGTMYVEPMGRDVIFYLYPSGFQEGNNTGMAATHVTAPEPEEKPEPDKKKPVVNDNQTSTEESNQIEEEEEEEIDKSEEAVNAVEEKIDAIGKVTLKNENRVKAARKAYNALTEEEKEKVENFDVLKDAETKIAKLKSAELEKPNTDAHLDKAEGLSLSTAKAVEPVKESSGNGKTIGIVIGVVVVLAGAGAGIYYIKKNKKGSGDYRDDDEI